ncbi:MAG: hypothetical protein ACFFDU_00555 [Candidatus Thorarchaeota archaeon]
MSSSSTWGYRNQELVLGALAGKVVHPTDIAQSEKALLSVNEGTLYFPIFYQQKEVGGVFIGFGQAIIDAIAETHRGAVGRSHSFDWNGSLLLLSEDGEWTPPSTSHPNEKDLIQFHLESADDAYRRAQEIFNRFYVNTRNWFTDTFIQRHRGWVATILDTQYGKCGIIASENRLVFKKGDLKIVLSGNKLVHVEGRKKILVAGRAGKIVRFG